MRVTCVFGPCDAHKDSLVNSLAWKDEALVMRTADYDFDEFRERAGCLFNYFLEKRWAGNNVVIDADDASEEARALLIGLFKPVCDELIGCTTAKIRASTAEGWDEVWVWF